MARAAYIDAKIKWYETQSDDTTIKQRNGLLIIAPQEAGRIDTEFETLVSLNDTPTQLEVKLRDSALDFIRAIQPSFSDWAGNDVYQCQIRRN